ncbi:MAG TPA: hypothetical protein PKY81_09145 [bacterium]|nr:hypothetical protein [bacterium]
MDKNFEAINNFIQHWMISYNYKFDKNKIKKFVDNLNEYNQSKQKLVFAGSPNSLVKEIIIHGDKSKKSPSFFKAGLNSNSEVNISVEYLSEIDEAYFTATDLYEVGRNFNTCLERIFKLNSYLGIASKKPINNFLSDILEYNKINFVSHSDIPLSFLISDDTRKEINSLSIIKHKLLQILRLHLKKMGLNENRFNFIDQTMDKFDKAIISYWDFIFYYLYAYLWPRGLDKKNDGYISYKVAIIKKIFECGVAAILTFKNHIYVLPMPIMKFNDKRQLHSCDGPAFIWKDHTKEWYLNGVAVDREIIEMPADKLDARLILKVKNSEVRREIVRKIGIERLCNDLNAACIDKYENYELLLLDIGDSRRMPYLKMINPSINAIHIEGVHPDCKNVKEALAWRNGTDLQPKVLT